MSDLFSYGGLPIEIQNQASLAAERIKLRLKRTAEDIVEIGKDLIATKANLPHGDFLPWVKTEFGMDQKTAFNFISVAERFGDKSGIIPNLSPTVLYLLASPSTSDEIIEQVIDLANSGNKITVAEVKRLKAENIDAPLSPDEELMLNQLESKIDLGIENMLLGVEEIHKSLKDKLEDLGNYQEWLILCEKLGYSKLQAETLLNNPPANFNDVMEFWGGFIEKKANLES